MKWSATRLFLYLFAATEATTFAFMSNSTFGGIVSLAGLVFLPGVFILLLMRPGRLSVLEKLLYSTALSVLTLMISGLLTNMLVPLLLGNPHPLSAGIQVPWTGTVLYGLLAAAWWRNRRRTYSIPKSNASVRNGLAGAAWLVLPLLSMLGATMQNNGGSNMLSVLMYLLVAGGGIGLVVWQKRVPKWMWPWAIFTMAVALLWSTSLRGLYITGHDTQLEYYVYRITDAGGRWAMSNFRDPYNACLSITILPTILHSLTKLDAIPLYKVAYQMWFALGMTGVWLVARRYLTPVLAFIAAFISLTFPTFVTDMPMLNRQEVAFVFFIVMMLAMFNARWSMRKRQFMLAALVLGVVLSHYSTTFVSVGMLGGAYLWASPARLKAWLVARRSTVRTTTRAHGVSIGVVTFMLAVLVLWTGVYTKTSSNVVQTTTKAIAGLPTLLKPKDSTDNSSYTILKSIHIPNQTLLEDYAKEQNNAVQPVVAAQGGLYPDYSNYPLTSIQQPTEPLTAVGGLMQKLGAAPGALTSLIKTGYALGLQALIMLGTGFMLWRRRKLGIEQDFAGLAVAAIALLALQAALTVIDYGILRLLQQALVFLGVPIVLGTMQLLKWLRLKSAYVRQIVLTASFAAVFLILDGVTGVLLGGSVGMLPLNNSGFYYDAYYTSSQDISTFNWLKMNYPAGYPINSDTFTRMKLIANTGITTVDGLVPGQITRKSYVVLTGYNVTQDRIGLYSPANGQLLFYRYPTNFLSSNKNLIYSTSSTQVYH